jgi:hypothetical protein
MLFAWVKAWRQSELAKKAKLETRSLINRVHEILGLTDLGSPAVRYRRLLADSVGGKDIVSTTQWCSAFKTDYKNTNDAYQLDEDAPAALSGLEKAMCQSYAQEELRWDGTDVPFPRWMTK